MKKRILLLLLMLVLMTQLIACSIGNGKTEETTEFDFGSSATTTIADSTTKKLVCLGDSIVAGYGLIKPEQSRFSALLAKSLSIETDTTWEEYNYGVSGDKSSDLIELLEGGNAPELKNADLIVVCIGANNILAPAQTFLNACLWYDVDESRTYTYTVTNSDVSSAYRTFREEAKEGISQLSDDLNTIFGLIRQSAPDSEILLMNIYNPYGKSNLKMNLGGNFYPLSYIAGDNIMPLNNVIDEMAEQYSYTVCDVATAVEQSVEVVINADDQKATYPDPHPNAAGHQLIANTLLNSYIVLHQND